MSNHDTVKPTLSVTAGIKRSGSVADDMTPTTPRPTTRFSDQTPRELACEDSSSSTPTHKHFPMAQGQRPLPDEPFAPSKLPDTTAESGSRLSREDSRRSIHSLHSNDSQDVEMGDDDDEGQDGEDRSDNESATSDSQRPSKKKKKGQRFYCTDYPPCQLSFTRSEHLARHIRKHTGERPFQCHCSRRFSRLDNLRQHAQTVHVNEEIPGDSLAATGTRFQRQVRTDRIRPPNTRPRASTVSSHGGHSRGHSRNLSASSITSSTSTLSIAEDSRPRPAPLAISQDSAARARLSLESFNPAIGAAATQYGVFQQSPGGYSTPTSATFSNGPTSPRFSSDMSSPTSTISRSSFYNGSRTPSRRLSVPSGSGAYPPSSHGSTYPPPYYSPMSNTNTIMASPNPSLSSGARRESDADLDWRRRTWHPGTQSNYVPRPATSGLSYHQTPDDAAPAMSSQPAASQVTRLPGIESFDHAPPPPVATTPRHPMSPPQLDHTGRPLSYPSADAASAQDDRRPSSGWETGLHQNLTRLDIGGSTTPRAPWHGHSRSLSSARPLTAPHSGYAQQYGHPMAQPPLQAPADFRSGYIEPMTGKRDRADKRQAWYGGPVGPPQGSQPIMIAQRTSPESNSSDGVPTPSTSHGREMHPAIRHSNGMIEMQPPGSVMSDEHQQMMQAHYNQSKPEPVRADSGYNACAPAFGQMPPAYLMQSGHDIQAHKGYSQTQSHPGNDMGRLEALVAVATSETRAVEHRS